MNDGKPKKHFGWLSGIFSAFASKPIYNSDPSPKASDGMLPTAAPLTNNEASFVKAIFGDEVDTACVRMYFYADNEIPEEIQKEKKNGFNTAAAVYGPDIIEFYGKINFSKDYSRTADDFNFGAFIHEMTHIWQYQSLSHKFNKSAQGYEYSLSSKSCFKNFGVEQQAAIIEDYARYYLGDTTSAWIKNTPENNELLKKVVEERFPQARKTRLGMSA